MNQLSAVCETIRNAGSLALICHVNPDGDTLGSALALCLCLRKLGKHVDVLCPGAIPKAYRFLEETATVLSAQKAGEYDAAVLVDLNSPERAGDCGDVYRNAPHRAVVDHHLYKEEPADPHYIRSDYGATAMAVMDLAGELGLAIDRDAARLLYVALVTDTGRFGYSNTDGRTMEYGARLVALIGDVSGLIEELYGRVSLRHTLLVKKTLEHMVLAMEGRVVWSILRKEDFAECGATAEDAEGLIDTLRAIEGVCACFVIRENPDGSLNVSMRSTREIRSNEIMELIGGGGHAQAAGAHLNGDPEETAARICDACRARLKETK
ncbi:MAG: bifunctional oligoribonuclease/PAP phosphatase NrnA [Eubacteriales bacterium]|nr:bifunctional oligoribonuclease/PAP phosphatase NrnA [Eubacteriales bacterium]